MRSAIFMINECIHNHPSKKLANKDRDMVVVLMKAHGFQRDKL
jgi:hypothetical protein